MGNSCVTGASRSKSGGNLSSNVTLSSPEEQTTFKWTIDGFSSLLDKGEGCTYSSVFEIMGLKWYLKLNPSDKKTSEEKEYVSLRLELSRSSVKPDVIVEASFKLFIYDRSYGKHIEHKVNHTFQTASTSSGMSRMISLRKLKSPSSGFLVDNSCVFGVQIVKVVSSKANTTMETLFVQKMSIFNEAKTCTWDIDDFFAMKNPDYSPEFDVGGYKWCISMYPSRDGNHLSLFLHMKKPNDLPKDSAKLVELKLSIKDQENGNHLIRAGRFQASNNAPVWGWPKFISLEDFKDSSNGYLVKVKCCVEAVIAVAGSSKTD
ncbi:hypothetical protein EJB05_21987 [Eragrostis curvula]|uniref:MATH domain-containing protein n=1 Tax=Eragrostis curvula TaxID=38414 RepID=A0A5J9V4R0_9POAL|nr:hypothetical protein EJB05_21987 [Eragrostis curvula]